MPVANWTEADTDRALEIWADYQRDHDLTDRQGQTAGIDPVTGRVWFDDSAKAIWEQMKTQGVDTPLYYVRVGSDFYVRKGGHR
jgi:uncharacterized protein YbjT (DUF2867 family)